MAPDLIENLEKLRARLNARLKPGEKEHGLTVTSCCRCPHWNNLKGGATDSWHLYDPAAGKASHAADVWCRTRPTREVYQAALDIPAFRGIGLSPPWPGSPGYVHVDVRPNLLRVQWGYNHRGLTVALAAVLPANWIEV